MRAWILSSLFLVACGPKAAPPQPAAEPEAAPPVVAEPEPEAAPPVEVAPPPEPEPPKDNADFFASVTRADGKKHEGRVRLLERSTDWFAEADWSIDPPDLKVTLEGDGKEIEADWKNIRSIVIKYGKVSPENTDCFYDSEFSPWMYTCTLKGDSSATTTDGKTWKVTSRHKWRFTFLDGTTEEFWLYKHPARMQDPKTYDIDVEADQLENVLLYEELQNRLWVEAKTIVTSVAIKP
ncbi:MAG: hypothetical protein JXB39_05540 [Deltaproteobacteria bacterium]|nr:hypothetical protein [Deltaproteobacteria bacterium]